MNLIEKLGLEKCKRIVDGAPEYSYAVVPCADGEMYFAQREDGKWFRYSDGYQKWLEYWGKCDPMDVAIKLDAIRTALADHDRIDTCSDIKNHISPNTKVIEHE